MLEGLEIWEKMFRKLPIEEVIKEIENELFTDMVEISLINAEGGEIDHLELTYKYGLIISNLEIREEYEHCADIKRGYIALLTVEAPYGRKYIQKLLNTTLQLIKEEV